jgi:hypothetical protein
MKKEHKILRKTLKVIMWVVIALVFLFIVVAVLIQIPAIQNKITGYAIALVSDKTQTRIEIDKVGISFPKSVFLKGIYLEDINKDTLIYAGEIKVNIALRDLLRNKINVNAISLNDVVLNLNRTEADSLFNFNFLITAFADTAGPSVNEPSADEEQKSKWTIKLGKLNMQNIRFRFDDAYGGADIFVDLERLRIKMDHLDLAHSIFDIDEFLLDGLTANVGMGNSAAPKPETQSSVPLKISARKLQIKNTQLHYGDSVVKQSVVAFVSLLELKDAAFDLEAQQLSSARLHLAKSDVSYTAVKKDVPDIATEINGQSTSAGSGWEVSVQQIDLEDNVLAYTIDNTPVIKNAFDANHLHFKDVGLKATDLHYSAARTTVKIKGLSAIDQNNFEIKHFETEFNIDQQSIILKKLSLATAGSDINADLGIQFSSLASLKDSLQYMMLNLDLRKVLVRNDDIVYFSQALGRQPFFRNSMNVTSLSGNITGVVNNLQAKNLDIKTGRNTYLKTSGVIKGLPDAQTAFYDFPKLSITTSKNDMMMMAGPSIPDNIEIPEKLEALISFTGHLKSFDSKVDLHSSFGSVQLAANIDKQENFAATLFTENFDMGSLLKDTLMFGPVSLTAEATGQGLDLETVLAEVKADASQIYLNQYNYQNLSLAGTVIGREFSGKIELNDEYAMFTFDGLVGLNPGLEFYQFQMNLQGADLQKLNITKDDIRIGMAVTANLEGGTVDKLYGTVGITNLTVIKDEKKYVLDSLFFASINEPNKSEFDFKSAIVGVKYAGNISPVAVSSEINTFINSYFPFSDSLKANRFSNPSDFTFEIQLHNHPILSEVLLPQLTDFNPGLIKGSFDSESSTLTLNAIMHSIVFGSTQIKDLVIDVNSNPNEINYQVSSTEVSNAQIKLDNVMLEGRLANNTLFAELASMDENKGKMFALKASMTKEQEHFRIAFGPDETYLMYKPWSIAADNYIAFGKQGVLFHNMFLKNEASQINIASVNSQFDDDLNIEIVNFKLEDISRIIEKDTNLAQGIVNAEILMEKVDEASAITANLTIDDLYVHNVPIGNLKLNAENQTPGKYDVELDLSGSNNKLTATGNIITGNDKTMVDIKTDIQALSMETIEAFSMGQITEASGKLSGDLLVQGELGAPEIAGELIFSDAFLKPAVLNTGLGLKQEKIQFTADGIKFNSFTITDPDNNSAVVNGSVAMKAFKDLVFALSINSSNFLLMNTDAKDNENYYGKMIIDSDIDIRGPMSLPVVTANIKVKNGSNFTFAVPESKLTADRGEGVVEFVRPDSLNPILYRKGDGQSQQTGFSGFELSSIIEIDKKATLRLLMDPASTDSLVVRGEAALSFSMDRSGKMSLTGAYHLDEGSYLISLESIVKKEFEILPGSSIVWNGDPLDATIDLNARYSVMAAPYDLMAAQMQGMTAMESGSYKQRFPFWVLLKLRGEILQPEISFEIQLPPEEKGILGGAVDQKLNMLNSDLSALNKQVFALLVLNRFIQENPLQTESGGTSTFVRSSVGSLLSAQLNKWSSQVMPGFELNFDIQSYDDYQSGQAEGRTQVEIGIKKQLFNERLSVKVGGAIDVEGEQAKHNNANDITSDLEIEYKLTEDGRYRLKGFRRNQYEGAIDGQLVETGIGIVFVRNFNKWRELFRKQQVEQEKLKNNKE